MRFSFFSSLSFIVSLVLFCGITLHSCRDDDPGPKLVLLTVNIQPGYFQSGRDVWMFISDANGNSIDVRNAKDSTQIRFSGTQRERLTLTILQHVAFPNSAAGKPWVSFSLDSYQEVTSGSVLDFVNKSNSVSIEVPGVIGKTPFTLINFDDSDYPEQSIMVTDGLSTPFSTFDFGSISHSGTTVSSQINVRKNPSKVLLTTYRNNAPVYKWLDNVRTDEPITVDFNSFTPTKTISVNKQIAGGAVKTMTGTNFATGYIFCEFYMRQLSKTSDASKLPLLGYLDGFDKYRVSVAAQPYHEINNLYYTKVGSIPQAINLPDFTYSISDDNLYGLSLTFSNPYSVKQAYFLKSTTDMQVSWILLGGTGENFRAPVIPSLIKKEFPMLNAEGSKLQYATYIHYLDGYSYIDFIQNKISFVERETYEEFRYVLKP